MAIKYNYNDDKVYIEQILSKPMVYLDNWAINILSNNETLESRFLGIANKKNLTVTFSIINIFEVVSRNDEIQKQNIVNFMSLLNDACIESNPAIVIDREKEYNEYVKNNANLDFCTAQGILQLLGIKSEPFRPLKVSNAVQMLMEEIKELNYDIKKDFEKELFPMIKLARQKEEKLKEAKMKVRNKIKAKSDGRRYTKELYEFCFWYIVSNEHMKMNNSEWRDIFHMIVPAAYCDFLLIDKRWVKFIQSTGLKYPQVAKVYSQCEIENFFNDLDDF